VALFIHPTTDLSRRWKPTFVVGLRSGRKRQGPSSLRKLPIQLSFFCINSHLHTNVSLSVSVSFSLLLTLCSLSLLCLSLFEKTVFLCESLFSLLKGTGPAWLPKTTGLHYPHISVSKSVSPGTSHLTLSLISSNYCNFHSCRQIRRPRVEAFSFSYIYF